MLSNQAGPASPMKQHLMRWVRARPGLIHAIRSVRMTALSVLPGADRRPATSLPPIDWSAARRDIAVPLDLVMQNVPVVPARRFHHEVLFDGGPVWPDFPDPPIVRHQVHDRPVDVNATASRRPGPHRTGPFVWGGRCLFHFGHLAAEHLNRLPAAMYHQPDAEVIFVLQPGKLIRDVPAYFWDMAAWFGVPAARIRFVTRPFIAGSLHVQAQTEHMSALAPPAWYLDLLDELPRLHGLAPVENRVLYVQRCGQLGKGNGAHAGETALVAALRRAGVAIMDPGQGTIAQQMALYAGAKVLIFAEGSALHGRQLLGRVDQTILVMRRRPGSMMARAQLAPRCSRLEYAGVVGGFVAPVHRNGARMLPHGITFTNLPALFHVLAQHGVDLSPHWDAAAHRADVAQDAATWMRAMMARSDVDPAATRRAAQPIFAQAGLT